MDHQLLPVGILSIVTPPAAEPIMLDEAKAHLRVDDHDGEIISAMIAARQLVEEWTGRALVTQTWDWFLPFFPYYHGRYTLSIPKPPLQILSSIKYIDASGALVTMPSTDYVALTFSGASAANGLVDPVYGSCWPSARTQNDAVQVRFVAGYGGPEKIPEPIRAAIKLLLGDLFENREAQFVGVSVSDNLAVERLLSPYVLRRLL